MYPKITHTHTRAGLIAAVPFRTKSKSLIDDNSTFTKDRSADHLWYVKNLKFVHEKILLRINMHNFIKNFY
jgi:hypothetical protein